MDRPIVYTQEQGRSTDFLFGQRAAMIGLAKMAAAALGTSTIVNGLACTPTGPASLSVNVGAGEIYSLVAVDATAYGVLPADTTDQILKQGISLATVNLACPAPSTSGFSVNYLIEAAYQDSDTTPVVLPYFNSANPSQPLTGQGGGGATQPTQRQGLCSIQVKAGAAATTGTQTTPAVDAGYTALYVVTVANGQTTITSSSISTAVGAPILPSSMLSSIISGNLTYGIDNGSANVIQATFPIPITALVDNMELWVKIKTTNTGATTFTPNPGVIAPAPVVGAAHQALNGNEYVANGRALQVWRADISSWVLVSCTGGAQQGALATAAGHFPQISQIPGKNKIIAGRFTTNQTAYVSGTAVAIGSYALDIWKSSTAGSTMTFTYAPAGQAVTISGSFQQVLEQGNIVAGYHTLSWSGSAQGRVYNSGASAPAYASSPVVVLLDGTQNVVVEFNSGTVIQTQLEYGGVATTYELRTPAFELWLAQRYIYVVNLSGMLGSFGGTGTYVAMSVTSPTAFRTTPTIILPGTAMTVGKSGVGTSSTTTASTSISSLTSNVCCFNVNGNWASGLSAGDCVVVTSTPGNTIFSARL